MNMTDILLLILTVLITGMTAILGVILKTSWSRLNEMEEDVKEIKTNYLDRFTIIQKEITDGYVSTIRELATLRKDMIETIHDCIPGSKSHE